MATQYIEDPETKERIAFEWSKEKPPTSEDINSLFQSVKKAKLPTADQAFGPHVKKAQRETYEATGEYVPESGLKPGQLSPKEIEEQDRQAGEMSTRFAAGLPWIGLAGGAALGTLAGPVGQVAGGGGGFAAGKKLEDLITGKKHTPVSALTSTGTDIAKGAALEAGGQVLGKVAPMVYRGAKNLIRPKAANIEDVMGLIKQPHKARPSATTGLRKGAETEMGEFRDIEKQLYKEAESITPKGQKVNFEDFNKSLDDFTRKDNQTFGRLKPPEKKEIRQAIDQIQREISPEVRGGLRGRTQIDPEQLADLVERGGFEDVGSVTEPGTFEAARATRSWLSEESAKAYKAGNNNLGKAYRELTNKLEKDLQKAVGKDAWATWKEADAFKTRSSIVKQIFGTKAEVRPGTYNPKTVEANIKKIPKERLEANFSKDEIQILNHIGDPGWIEAFSKTHPGTSRFLRHLVYWSVPSYLLYKTVRAVSGR